MKKLSIVIPFLNEENTITEMLNSVISVDLSHLWYEKEIILVNDWSTDKSEEKIKPFLNENVRYLKNDKNMWKGYSIKRWFSESNWDLMIIQDADQEYDPNDYKPLIELIEKEWLDFVYWSRITWMKKYENSYSTASFLLWWLLVSFITTILTFKKVTDEPTCYKLYRKNLTQLLISPKENWFEWEPAATMLLLRKWFKYWEYPIHYHARKVTEGKKIKWKDWVKAIWTLIKWRFN